MAAADAGELGAEGGRCVHDVAVAGRNVSEGDHRSEQRVQAPTCRRRKPSDPGSEELGQTPACCAPALVLLGVLEPVSQAEVNQTLGVDPLAR